MLVIHFKVQELEQENKRLQSDLNEVNTSALQQVRYSVWLVAEWLIY